MDVRKGLPEAISLAPKSDLLEIGNGMPHASGLGARS